MSIGTYFIAILLPEDLTEKIRLIQKEFSTKYDSKRQLKIPVHITLIPPFKADEDIEQTILSALHEFVETEQSFTIGLRNFGNFRRKVVYIDVVEDPKLIQLKQNLDRFILNETELGLKQEYSGFHPHVTVANRDLSFQMFVKAWKEFSERKFDATFSVDGICLLKHNGSIWEILQDSSFKE